MNHWVTIFDVTSEPFRWGNAGEGLAAMALVALGISGAAALRRRRARGATGVLALAAGVAVFFAVRTLDHRREHEACIEAERSGGGSVLEGVVRDFRPAASPWRRPLSESFVIDGELVRYPIYARGCGFHRTTLRSPIGEGMRVRLVLWKGQILKLEIDERDLGKSWRGASRPPG